jgi:ferredoxin
MRIVIDRERCTGNGRCYALFRELFSDDERGHGQVIGDGVIHDHQLDDVRRAVIALPRGRDHHPRRVARVTVHTNSSPRWRQLLWNDDRGVGERHSSSGGSVGASMGSVGGSGCKPTLLSTDARQR